jgi:hypothetical protein
MKRLLITLLMLLLTIAMISAQHPVQQDWLTGIGGPGQWSARVKVAAPYVAGSFQQPITFGARTVLPQPGGSDCWISRVDPAGTPVWMRSFGGAGSDQIEAIATDVEGNLYVTGTTFSARIVIDGRVLVKNGDSAGTSDAFAAKFDPFGTCLWIVAIGGTNIDEGQAIHAAGDGSIYVAGSSVGVYNNLPRWGGADALLTKLDASGAIVWQRRAGSYGNDGFTAVTTNEAGQVFVGGNFGPSNRGNWYIGDQVIPTFARYSTEAVLASFTPAGDLLWGQTLGGPGIDTVAYLLGFENDVIVTGSGYLTMKFGGITVTAGKSPDVYVVRMNEAGKGLWGARWGGSRADYPQHLATDGEQLLVSINADCWNTATVNYGHAIYWTLDPRSGKELKSFRLTGEQSWAWGTMLDVSSTTYIGTFQKAVSVGRNSLSALGIQDIFVFRKHRERADAPTTWSINY